MTQKRCACCKQWKDRTEYFSAKNRPDGLYNYCRPCAREAGRKDYRKHRERALAYQKEYSARPEVAAREHARAKANYWAHRDHHLSHAKQWRRENMERRRAYVRHWNDKNREKVRQYQQNYKARKRGASDGPLTIAAWRLIQMTFRSKCVYCGNAVPRLEQDHVIPLSRGGMHAPGNVVPACRTCNATKIYNSPPPFWWTRSNA